jgi:rRNA maturation endonuclease Nob1
MRLICEVLGHKLMNSINIMDDGKGFYEVEYVKVCERCGEINPKSPKFYKYISLLF